MSEDPKRITFLLEPGTFGDQAKRVLKIAYARTDYNREYQGRTVYEVTSCENTQPGAVSAKDCIMNTLRAHVKAHGTIDDLMITGHGAPGNLGSGQEILRVAGLIQGLQELQQEMGVPITRRVVFSGCNIFSGYDESYSGNRGFDTEDYVELLRDTARTMQMEIVGTSSYAGPNPFGFAPVATQGRYVQFTPQGKIVRDKLDSWLTGKIANLFYNNKYSDAWIDCHLNATQEEGEACMAKLHEKKEERVAERQLSASLQKPPGRPR